MSVGAAVRRRPRTSALAAWCAAVAALVLALTACTPSAKDATAPGGSGGSGSPSATSPGEKALEGGDPTMTKAPVPGGVLKGKVITVDPGHNGGNAEHPEVINELVDVLTKRKPCDTTGTETDDGYTEHEFNWDVAQRLAKTLRDQGAKVVLTRDGDDGVGPCITERTSIGNDSGSDVAVSIHADGGSTTGHGFHIMEPVLIDGHTDKILEPSQELAVAIRDAYEEGTGLPPSTYIGEDGLNPRDDMGGLNLTTVPKVMVECGNMRNAGDAAKLKDPDFRQRIADSLAAGLTAFLTR